MGAYVLTDCGVVLDEFDVSTQTVSIDTLSASADMVRVSAFKKGGFEHYLPALASMESAVSGLADYASGGVAREYPASQVGAQAVLTLAPQGYATANDPAVIHRGLLKTLTHPTGAVGEAAKFAIAMQSDTGMSMGARVAAPLTSYTTSGLTGTAIAMTGPTATQYMYAALHVTAASGTNLVVKIQSDDNSSFTSATDRITFSTVSAVGSQWSSVAGDLSTETHWRAVITVASGTFSCLCSIGVG
jgi:hypothetical protein